MIYEALAFRQTVSSPVQVAFVAPTSELDQWARVPTRLSSQPHGFQRAELKRHVEDIFTFFQGDENNRNSSPTSILLGLDPALRDHIKVLAETGELLDDKSISTEPVRCRVQIEFNPWDSSAFGNDLNNEIRSLLDAVLPGLIQADEEPSSESEDPHLEFDLLADESDDLHAVPSEDLSSEDELDDELADEEDADELNSSPLLQADVTLDPLTQEDIRELEFLAGLNPDRLSKLSADNSYEQWTEERRTWLIRALKDELKPGLIIDGQHRVRGTKDLQDVPFLVDLLPHADWPELAFQFIVNNGSAKRVSNNLLMAIVGQSLSSSQLETIEARLLRAGIKVSLIRASMRLQIEENPFQSMLDTGTPGEPGFLDATAMQRKVVEIWFGRRDKSGLKPRLLLIRHPVDKEAKKYRLIDLFGANCPKGSSLQKAEFWQGGDSNSRGLWFDYFTAFWEAVRDTYSPRLWPPSRDEWPLPKKGAVSGTSERLKLMRATMLGLVQHCVLYRWALQRDIGLNYQQKRLAKEAISPEEFYTEIKNILHPLSEDFFLDHKATGLDASDDMRKEFCEQCYKVLSGDKKIADVKKTPQWMSR